MPPTAPRKPPRQQRSRQTVDAVLEAAAQVLEAGGLPAFNTNAVARRAGASIGSLYQYFPGKDAVMVALVRREAARFEHALGVALRETEGLPLAEAVDRLIAVGVTHQTARPRLAQILDLEERRLGIGAEAEHAAASTAGQVETLLVAHGVRDPGVAALDLMNLTRGMIDGAAKTAPGDLARRIGRAARGYLGI